MKVNVSVLETGRVYESEFANAREVERNGEKLYFIDYNINGVLKSQRYSDLSLFLSAIEDIAAQLNISSVKDTDELKGKKVKVILSLNDNTNYKNIYPARNSKEDTAEEKKEEGLF